MVFDPRTAKEDAVEPSQRMWPLSSSIGDANKAIAGAAVKIEQTYTMPDRHHNPMEPHATLAVWDDNGTLTLYDSTQMVVGTRKLVSLVLGVAEEKINVVCEFLGGGFGGKSWSWPHTLLGRARREGGEPAGALAAQPRADVFDGRPPGGDRSDDCARRRS